MNSAGNILLQHLRRGPRCGIGAGAEKRAHPSIGGCSRGPRSVSRKANGPFPARLIRPPPPWSLHSRAVLLLWVREP